MRKPLTTILLAASIALPLPAATQPQPQAGYTLAQVERLYPRMRAVHIEKCDRDRDGIYTKSEMLCVQSIYHAMYIEN